jgi:hypothetical protein
VLNAPIIAEGVVSRIRYEVPDEITLTIRDADGVERYWVINLHNPRLTFVTVRDVNFLRE